MTHKRGSVDIGPLSNKGQAKHYTPQRVILDVPTRVTNSSVREPYVAPAWNTRAGSGDFLACESKGLPT